MAHYHRAVPANQLTSADPSVWVSATAAPRGRPGHTPIPRIADAFAALAGLGFGVTLALVVAGETRGSLAAPGGLLIAAGRLTGFTGAYLMLVMVVLIARIPWLERSVGQDRLLHWHRRIGPWSLWLIASHVALVTFGYAQQKWAHFDSSGTSSRPIRTYSPQPRLSASLSWSVSLRSRSLGATSGTRPGGSSTSIPTPRSLSPSPTRSSPVARSSATRSPERIGSLSGWRRREASLCSGSSGRSFAIFSAGSGSSPSKRRHPGSSRSPARVDTLVGSQYPEASSSSGAS